MNLLCVLNKHFQGHRGSFQPQSWVLPQNTEEQLPFMKNAYEKGNKSTP